MMMSNMLWNMACDVDDYAVDDDVNDDTDYGVDDLFVCCCSFFFFFFLGGGGALRPKSTAMVMAGRSVHLTTLFPGHILSLVTDNNHS